MRRWLGLRPTTWLTGAVLVLLPVLATLQYRWLSQIGAETRSQMRAVAANAMAATAADLAFEVARALRERVGGSGAAIAGSGAASLVTDALVIDREAGREPRLRRWDIDAGTCGAVGWPAGFDAVRGQLQHGLAAMPARELHHLADGFDRISTSLGVVPVALPDEDAARSAIRPPCEGSGPGVMLFRLDLAALRRTLLPEVVRRHLDSLERDDFLFAIVAGPSHDQVVYATAGADAATLAASPDVAMPLAFDAGEGTVPRPPEIGSRGGDRGGPRTRGPGPRRDAYGGWLLVAQHRAGSLDAAVAGLRARNLALSFGILLLLGVAVAMIGVNARRAERLARQQVEFVAGVSHEMRTPVSAIEVAARNLEDGLIGDPARVQRYGRVIGAEARRLGETVERVLQFAAIDAGRVRGTACPVDLALVVEDVVSHARTENPLASFDAAVERACTVQADPGVLRACVRNLVENALKYGGKPGWVRVSLTRRGNGDRMEGCLEVEDRGPGIEASDLPHVFEPFYRGRLATEHRIPGSGLGLHIVKRSIEQMGGEVRVSSRPGTGTTMRLTLPLCPAMSHDDGEPTTRSADRG